MRERGDRNIAGRYGGSAEFAQQHSALRFDRCTGMFQRMENLQSLRCVHASK
jgi:hypothetical protein